MSFNDMLFPVDISYGSKGGPQFNTEVIEISSGFESRNINWSQARAKYDISYGVKTGEQLEALISFFNNAGGKAYSFKYKDWSDFQVINQVCPPSTLWPDPGYSYQLQKVYSSGGYNYTRYIYLPFINIDQSNILVYVDGVLQPGNWDAFDVWGPGILYFDEPLSESAIVTATYEFFVLVRFDIDKLPISLDNYNAAGTYFGGASIPLIEVSDPDLESW
jgi:uncharacterized protein (TIGR02217 family)